MSLTRYDNLQEELIVYVWPVVGLELKDRDCSVKL
jgi:hypothetical protein